MFDLGFTVMEAKSVPHAATAMLAFTLRLTAKSKDALEIQNVLLRCQIRIEPSRRGYGDGERAGLLDLFGTPSEWGRSLQPMLWTHATTTVPSFAGSTDFELPVPCSYDFNLAATKYFDGLESGEVPLCFLFSGTIFYLAQSGRLQVAQVPWDREATFRLPVSVWKNMMEHYHPNSAWLELRKDVFDRLRQVARERGLTGPAQAVATLLEATEAVP